jgi:uncharacterized protein (DUF1800 family)
MDGGSEGRLAAAKRLPAPRSLKTTNVAWSGVTLKWAAPRGAKPKHYLVLRDGKRLGKTTRTSFTDATVKPGRTYRYAIRALDARGRAGAMSSSVRVKVPRRPSGAPAPSTNPSPPLATVTPTPLGATPIPAPAATPTPAATATPTPPPPPVVLTEAMVDRLFWRAGFGPTQAQRDTWTGRTPAELVDWFLDTPSALDESKPKPLTSGGLEIDPLASDIELELDWIDRMQRAINPLPDRLAFFWHRHWAISRDDGIDYPWVLNYRNRLLRFADFGTTPALTFRDLAFEMTTADSAMSLYLNMNQNVRGKPNENYAREFMELFCLGPKGPDGTDNYTQDDVAGLAKAFTGWTLNGNSASPDYGRIAFNGGRYELNAKTFLGLTIPQVTQAQANVAGFGVSVINQSIAQVLKHANHAQFLIRKLWAEFIAGPIPQATLDSLVAAYTGSNYQLRPVIRGILLDPLIFESIDEPNLVKPPIVQLVGVVRQLDAPLKHNFMQGAMVNMQQRIYRPPNVAGWEGGMSWLNTNTVQGRFDLVIRAQYLKYSNYYFGATDPVTNPVGRNYPADVAGETKEAVFDRAYAAANRPWISAATKAAIVNFAGTLPVTNAQQRRQRFYAVQALILGGPDGQVM